MSKTHEWLTKVVRRLSETAGCYSSECAHLLLANNVLRAQVSEVGFTDEVAWFELPLSEKLYDGVRSHRVLTRRVFPIFFCDLAAQYRHCLRWVTEKAIVLNVDPTVAAALNAKRLISSGIFFEDFLVLPGFHDGWAGGKWKGARRSLSGTKAVRVEPTWDDVVRLDAGWLAFQKARGEQLHFQNQDGSGLTQIGWLAANQELLRSAGVQYRIFGWAVGGEVVSAQVFCPISKDMFYAFTHRVDRAKSEDHMCYEEMVRAFDETGWGRMNDGSAPDNDGLRARKKKYSDLLYTTQNVWSKNAK